LPWKRLAITAVNAGVPLVPAWTVMDVVSAPIVVNAVLSVAVYGAFYGALWYLLHGHINPVVPAVPVTAPVASFQQET